MRPLKTNSLSLNQVLIIIVCLILFAVAGSYVAFSSHAATTTKPTGIVSLSVSPASGRLAHGDNLNLQIWENSYTQSVNAVQADLNYDATKLTFVSIDTSSSALTLKPNQPAEMA